MSYLTIDLQKLSIWQFLLWRRLADWQKIHREGNFAKFTADRGTMNIHEKLARRAR